MIQPYAFISYVRENRDVIDCLAKELRAFGVTVWLDRNDIRPGQWWKDAINDAIQKGAFFIACFSKELNERQETYMHGELRLAIDRLRNMPKNRVWFIPVLINQTVIPSHTISDHETLKDINAVMLFDQWDNGVRDIIRAMKIDDPEFRRTLHLLELIKYHPAERVYAIEQLRTTRIRDSVAEVVPTMIELLGDSNVRMDAERVLVEIGAPAVPALIKFLADADADARVRPGAVDVLRKIHPAPSEVVPLLIKLLGDADILVRMPAALMLYEIGSAAAEAFPALVKLLGDAEKTVRLMAAAALLNIDKAAAEAIPAVINLFRGDADKVCP
jgi:hypothetical protein